MGKRLASASNGVLRVKRFGKGAGRNYNRSINKNTRERVLQRDGYRCVSCGNNRREELTMDHIKPRSKGGKNEYDNLQTMCGACNEYKGDRT